MAPIPIFITRDKAKTALPEFEILTPNLSGYAHGTTTITTCTSDFSPRHHDDDDDDDEKSPSLNPSPFVSCEHSDGGGSHFSLRALLRSSSSSSSSSLSSHHHRHDASEHWEMFLPTNSLDAEPMIPSPRVFEKEREEGVPIGPPFLPSVTHCAVHLELLEVFWQLRYRVTVVEAAGLDVVFGYKGRGARWWREKKRLGVGREWRERERERLWEAFVECAVERFEEWWEKMERVLVEMVGKKEEGNGDGDKSSSSEDGGTSGEGDEESDWEFPEHALPPLDVLLVWYSYMLIPKTYFDNADAPKTHLLWNRMFPWDLIHTAIDPNTWTYTPPPCTQTFYTTLTTQPFHLLSHLLSTPTTHPTRMTTCPSCLTPTTLPTTDPIDFTGWVELTSFYCRDCKSTFSRSQLIKHSPLATDLTKSVLSQIPFWDEIHRHLWIRSPALSGKAYWGDIYLSSKAPSSSSSSSASTTSLSSSSLSISSRHEPPHPHPLPPPPSGTLERALARLSAFITTRGNIPTTTLPADVALTWRTISLSPPLLSHCHPELNGRKLHHLASCSQIGVDRKKAVMNARRYGPAEWVRCLCWACEAGRMQKEVVRMRGGGGKGVRGVVGWFERMEEGRRRGGGGWERDVRGER
ncbi:hypothetical protein EX30DRAFT_372186 [Ascodesmis nigricans]|uniref:Uncharacterized protein n=1 Tax=Ascodesmis nigricans TaxID=341454 RepID=A0A4S2MVL5_9PEZI|nr:hypothetical protein EX30DRAFT_372186 [Ascodesmis nigricans]